jgi:hypothetical protein
MVQFRLLLTIRLNERIVFQSNKYSQPNEQESRKMGNVRIDLANVITISLVAFAGVFVINRVLIKFGMEQWKA